MKTMMMMMMIHDDDDDDDDNDNDNLNHTFSVDFNSSLNICDSATSNPIIIQCKQIT